MAWLKTLGTNDSVSAHRVSVVRTIATGAWSSCSVSSWDLMGLSAENIEFLGMVSAKCLSSLNPGEPLTINLSQQGDGAMEFTCASGSRLIASGSLRYRIVADDPPGDS